MSRPKLVALVVTLTVVSPNPSVASQPPTQERDQPPAPNEVQLWSDALNSGDSSAYEKYLALTRTTNSAAGLIVEYSTLAKMRERAWKSNDSTAESRANNRMPVVETQLRRLASEPSAARPLVAALHHSSDEVRTLAARTLGERRDPATITALVDVLRTDGEIEVRANAAESLAAIGKPCADELAKILGHEKESVRDYAAIALGWMGDTRALAPLIGDLSGPGAFFPRMRFGHSFTKTAALARLGNAAIGPAIELINDPKCDDPSQSRAIEVLVGLGAAGIDALVATMSDNRKCLGFFFSARTLAEAPSAIVHAQLASVLRERRLMVIRNLIDYYLYRGIPGSESVLIEAFWLDADVGTATRFLNSGNAALESCARRYAAQNGYSISKTTAGVRAMGWGSAVEGAR
jgi:hypothetical protein